MPTYKTFEYCSLHYLNQWLTYDRDYCLTLANGNESEKLATLKNAGGFYRVARNLPTEHEEKEGVVRYKPVLDIIDCLERSQFEKNPVEEILKIAEKISGKYGGRNVLSLTTKFLWIKIKQPILIYDSQARIALGTKNGDLDAYYAKWRKEFESNKEEIVDVCSKLPDMNKYAINQEIGTKEVIKNISNELWFHERVFDIFLWSKG